MSAVSGLYTLALPATATPERLRPGALLQRCITAAHIEWPLDEYRAEELLQLTTDADYTAGWDDVPPATEIKEDTVTETAQTTTGRRKLDDREIAQIKRLGPVGAIARTIGASPNHLSLALTDYPKRPRSSLSVETIDKLLSLTTAEVARHESKAGRPSRKAEPAPRPARPALAATTAPAAPAVTTRSLRELALELYLTGTEEDRATLRALLGIGGAR